jgi:lysophospholipase L1-like esterase
MVLIEKPNRIKLVIIGLIALLQCVLILSLLPLLIDQNSSIKRILGILTIVELCILFMIFSCVTNKFSVAAITLFLLFTVNIFTPSIISRFGTLKNPTLPKNLKTDVKIVGDVMPGFSGISHISTDNKGFRVTKTINYDQKKGVRIFAIGGSTTEQIYIDDAKTWTALLEGKLQKSFGMQVEVINTGLSGLRAEHHFYVLKNILQYSPDIVIFMMGINDWNLHIKENFEKQRPLHFLSSIDFRNSLLFVKVNSFRELVRTKSFRELFKPPVDNPPTVRIEDGSYYSSQNDSLSRPIVKRFQPQMVSEDYQFWVQKIARLCRGNNLKCIFVNQPVAYQGRLSTPLKKRLWMTPPNEEYTLPLEDMGAIADLYNNWLINYSHQNNVESCNIADQVHPTIDYFYDDCHFNEGGAKKISSLLSQCIMNMKTTINSN